MAKDREIACVHYDHEGSCRKGRKGFFNSTCQHCNIYQPNPRGTARRKNLKREKSESFMKDKRNWD